MNKLKEKPWYSNVIVVCIGILFYVLLINVPSILNGIKTFIGFFEPVIVGCIIAYIVNPLAKLFNKLLHKIKNKKLRESLSNILAFIIIICLIFFFLIILIPQLIDSITALSTNLPEYANSLENTLHNFGATRFEKYIHNTFSSSEKLMTAILALLQNNSSEILETSASAGKSIINFGIAFLLSIYILGEKEKIIVKIKELFLLITPKDKFKNRLSFIKKCNYILNRYVIFNLLDSFIIGILNTILMLIFRLPYIGLISFVIGITNLVPTVGPIIGGLIGVFILILVKPIYALIFLIITIILQTLDGYIIKPKMFGNTLGISGLWILIGIIVGGRMFGILGILFAIPVVAILDLLYNDYILPYLKIKFNS